MEVMTMVRDNNGAGSKKATTATRKLRMMEKLAHDGIIRSSTKRAMVKKRHQDHELNYDEDNGHTCTDNISHVDNGENGNESKNDDDKS